MPTPKKLPQMMLFDPIPVAPAPESSDEDGPQHIPITTVDLFAGAGGLSLGFHLADLGLPPHICGGTRPRRGEYLQGQLRM